MKNISALTTILLFAISAYSQDVLTGSRANAIAPGSEMVRMSRFSDIPDFVRFRSGREITQQQVVPYLQQHFQMSTAMAFSLLSATPDQIGLTHYRYQQTFNGIPLQGTMYIVHVRNGKVVSMNGMIFSSITSATASLSETDALQNALHYVNASLYRWQIPGEESLLQMMTKNPEATWYPKGELTYAPDAGAYSAGTYKLTYRFDVYALEPLSRQYIFVDAQNGKVVYTKNRIQDNNPVEGTAHTGYSGIKTIIADGEAANKFYLRDSLRGNGVITLDMNNSYYNNGAVNFQDADNNWNNINADLDQYATDSHYGMEKTYDLYDSVYNRNSIDDNGFELFGYVHYGNNYFNAFWDGQEMTFGDGYGSPLTTLDITGHEITHGLTEFTCNLDYTDEPGGLNESFSDIAGEMVERMGKGVNDWMVGAELGYAFRYFSDPSADGISASSYGDAYWNYFNDPHFWSGPQNHWFYILSVGDTGINSLGVSYSVAGIGMDEAHAITFRSQTVYLFPSAQYADARFYAIQSAIDLYGACTQEVISCTDAWHAIGVGNVFDATVIADFTASATTLCSLNDTIYFNNLSTNGGSFLWNFGDGTSSNDMNPAHLYSSEGTYNVSLYADGGNCGTDSLEQLNFITIALPAAPTASNTTTCQNSPAMLTGSANGTITWYDVPSGGAPLGTGSPFYTAPLVANTTFYAENDEISPVQTAGALNNNFGTGSYATFTNPRYCIFDAYTDFTLKTVTVYSDQSGVRTIELLDNAGNLINSSTQNIGNGTVTVTLNFPITSGSGYWLGLQDGSLNHLYRNQTGANFPYTLSGMLSITGNDIPDQEHYYYFYNWKVQKGACTSSRVPAEVTVLPTPTAMFTYAMNGHQATFTNNSVGGATSYEWIFGDGSTSLQTDPVHQYPYDGNFNVLLVACTGNCCDTISQVVSVLTGIPGVNSANAIFVSPNPFENYLQLNYSASNASVVKVELTDVLGRVLLSEVKNFSPGNQEMEMNTSQLPAGIYFIHTEQDGESKTLKVVKQR
ncbi:MAG TPA: M4 family metallopeptidase [Chitinophagales bacterium]|nr:M4 family metallopeptidase [Chitinophagales bacterium]